MLSTTAHNLVQNFDAACDNVIQNCEPIIITRSNNDNVVLISQAEYNNLIENLYISRNNSNNAQLLNSIKGAGKKTVLYDGEELSNSLLSEHSLSKDWLREEEEAAWQNL